MTEDQIKMSSTDSLDSCSISNSSDKNSLFLEENYSNNITISDDNFEYSVSEIEGEISSNLSSFEENSLVDRFSSDFNYLNEEDDESENSENNFDYVFKKCDNDVFFNNIGFSTNLSDENIFNYNINDYLMLEPYLHYSEELDKKDEILSKRCDLINELKQKLIEDGNNFAVNGNKRIFQEELIELKNNHFGHPSSISHDNSGIIFVGTIKGFCLIYLETNSKKCIVIDPVNGVLSKITSICISKSESKDFVFLSLATIDGSLCLWKLNIVNIKEFLMHDCNLLKHLDNEVLQDNVLLFPGSNDCEKGCLGSIQIFHIKPLIKEEKEYLEENKAKDMTDTEINNKTKNETVIENGIVSEMAILLNNSPKHIKHGILNHEFIDIRTQESLNRLAIFISDLQGNLYVTLLVNAFPKVNNEDEAYTNNEKVANEWIIHEKIFLYNSEEDIIHQFKSLPPPPLKKNWNQENTQINTGQTSKREIHPMDHYQFYLVAGRKGFSLISMLPHPALCNIVNLVDDLKKVNIDIVENEANGVYLTWLRPSIISKNAEGRQMQIRILASISRFLCIYEIKSFEEFENSDEIKVELKLSAVWTMFDSIHGVFALSENIIASLVGFRGIYIYQIVEDYDGFNSTTKLCKNTNELNVITQAFIEEEDKQKQKQKQILDNILNNSVFDNSRNLHDTYLIVKSKPIDIVNQVNEMLVCIHKYTDNNKKLFVVSQNVTNDLQESIDLYGQSFIQCKTGKSIRVLLLLNDKIILLLMLFKSWIPFLENEFNVNMEQIKSLVYDDVSWSRLSASFISLYEKRLPSLQTWTNIDKNMILNILKNIFNSLLDSVAGFHSKIESKLFEVYIKQVIKLIIDSSIRLKLWEYLFEELIPVIQSYNFIQLSQMLKENFEVVSLLDYYLMSIVDRFIGKEMSWELLDEDFLKLLINWYKNRILKFEKCKIESNLKDYKVKIDDGINDTFNQVQFILIRTLKMDYSVTNSCGGNGNPWLTFVPLFKKYGVWTSYILLYLFSKKDPIDLFKRIMIQMYEYFIEGHTLNQENETFSMNNNLLQVIDIVKSQKRLEENCTIQSYYYYIYSLIFRDKYPFDEGEIKYLDFKQITNIPLSSDIDELIKSLSEEIKIEKLKIIKSNCDLLILISFRFYVSILIELKKIKNSLIHCTEEIVNENNDGEKERKMVKFEKIYLVMEDKLELFVYKVLKIDEADDSNKLDHLINSDSPLKKNLDLKTEILKNIIRKSNKFGLSVNYLLGNYLNWVIFNIKDFNIKKETDYKLLINCFFKIIEKLSIHFEETEQISNLVKCMEYNLIMAIINSNRNNEGMNFLNILLICLGMDNYTQEDELLSFEHIQVRKDYNKVEMNQRLSKILKKYSLYNLSLYLSIQVYDLESILDMYSKKHFINNSILRELYIMDEENNNILFSLNYILDTIEKGISFKVFDYDQVFVLIIKYTDLLIKIDSLNTIDLIIHILSKCLNDEFNSTSKNSVIYYAKIIQNNLNQKVKKLLLSSLLYYKNTRNSFFQEELLLSEKSIYKNQPELKRWNELVNQLIPQYLESFLKEKRTNDSSVLGILDYWYQSSVRYDELLNTPFEKCFCICREFNNEFGLIYINQIFSVNPNLYNPNVCENSDQIFKFCILRFKSYLSKIRGLLEGKFSKEVFSLNSKIIAKDKTILYSLNIEEVNSLKSRRDFCLLWEELIEFTNFIYLYCFTNYNINSNYYYNMKSGKYIEFFKDILKSLLAEIESVSERYNNKILTEIAEEFYIKKGNKISQNMDLKLLGMDLIVILYYILACFILGNGHYQYLLEKYLIKFGFLSDFLFNSKLNKLFPNPIGNYYIFIKPILQLIISEAKSKSNEEADRNPNINYPCKFWRHLALEMMNTKIFIDKCNDEVGQLFQGDLLHIFYSFVNAIRKAIIVQFNDQSKYFVNSYETKYPEYRNKIHEKYLRYGLKSSCFYCKQSIYSFEEDDLKLKAQNNLQSYSFNIISNGVNEFSFNDNNIFKKNNSQSTIEIERPIQQKFSLNGKRENEDSDEENDLMNINKLYVFHCGNVFHKKCLYSSINNRFGLSNNKKDEISNNIYIGDKEPINNCLHKYRVSFNY
ncbi:large low complexity [Cryptosporidium sp. chipmunk genotype I]|uniref:large low complexity n=1 Tax=Cryptosporidium sp. chipmunk genotype I TaxID=1280935 RepID=UPI00351A16DC|nr:large low complexity [Cryptosporidium sp. chipmunk genotype I]